MPGPSPDDMKIFSQQLRAYHRGEIASVDWPEGLPHPPPNYPINVTPEAEADGATTGEDSGIGIAVLDNDQDLNIRDTLSVASLDTTGTKGSATIGPDDVVTYDPGPEFQSLAVGDIASDSFGYTVSDGRGGTDTATVSVSVLGVNDAPLLDTSGAPVLTAIDEDTTEPPGGSVASILATAAGGDPITDVDAGAVEGVAVTTVDEAHGDWRFSLDGGTAWASVGPVSASSALLLDPSAMLRFVPDPDFSGTATFVARAWDQTTGESGGRVDVTANGGTTAFSSAAETFSITVNEVSDTYAYTPKTYNAGFSTTGVSVLDVDGNGRTDVLVGNYANNRVEWWEYSPVTDGLVRQAVIGGFAQNIHDVRAADINSDGDKDLLVGTRGTTLQLVLNNGNGTFAAPVTIDPSYSWQVIVEDFDGDGAEDLFHGIDGTFSNMFYGNGAGGFSAGAEPPQVVSGSRGLSYNAVDLNDDGRLDLIGVQSAGGPSQLTAYLNTSTPGSPGWSGNIASGVPQIGPVEHHVSPSAADFNVDGFIDVVTLEVDRTGTGSSRVIVYEGGETPSGDLTWTANTVDTLPGIYFGPLAADVNDDGLADLVGPYSNSQNGLPIYYGDGTGFEKQQVSLDHPVGNLNAAAVGDVNGDGRTDIVVGRTNGFDVLFADDPLAAPASLLGGFGEFGRSDPAEWIGL